MPFGISGFSIIGTGTYRGRSIPLILTSRRSRYLIRVVLIPTELTGWEFLREAEMYSNLTVTLGTPSGRATLSTAPGHHCPLPTRTNLSTRGSQLLSRLPQVA